MKECDIVIDDDGDIGIIVDDSDSHNIVVKYLSCKGCGFYCIDSSCDKYDSDLRLHTTADIRLRYRFAQIIQRITSYIRKRCETFNIF
jgi:hypothetical protein